MAKVKKYQVIEYWTAYSKKKGSYEKSRRLYSGQTLEQIEVLKNTELKQYKFEVNWEGNLEARKSGLIYPGRIVIK